MEKKFINSLYCKQKKFSIGISGNADKLIEEIRANKNSKGDIRLELCQRKQPDKNGNTHYLVVDTWEPAKTELNNTKDAGDLPF